MVNLRAVADRTTRCIGYPRHGGRCRTFPRQSRAPIPADSFETMRFWLAVVEHAFDLPHLGTLEFARPDHLDTVRRDVQHVPE